MPVIYCDAENLPVDQTGDAGDSAVRAGILKMCNAKESWRFSIRSYHSSVKPGWLRRHPTQVPWNNWLNFTRDQLIPVVAGTLAQADTNEACRAVFWTHARRLFFCQNFQRDHVGTWKKPWPHIMTGGDPADEGKNRNFDFADPLMPNHIWALIKAARIKWLYVFGVIGIPFFVLSLLLHSVSGHKEHNQVICESYINGRWAIKLFRLVVRNWEKDSFSYWNSRNEIEYHLHLVELVNNG